MKKKKLTKEEIEKARQEKIDKTLGSFSIQLTKLGRTKAFLVTKLVNAKQLGLKQQEIQARGLLGNCLAQEKRVLGMQMQLELAVQSRDLSNLEQSFLECVNEMADEVSTNVTKSGAKKAKKNYLKTLFKINQQNERMDDLLAEGDYATMADYNSGKFSQFDDEIDSLVEMEQSRTFNANANRSR